MPSTPSPIRLAFVAALAAFALGACSGGGGGTAGSGTPATGGASNPFPTTTGKEIAQGCCLEDGSPASPTQSLPAGLKLADFQALPGVPYSEFALTGRPDKTVAGIPVHTDTSDSVTDEDGKTYSAVAYRSVLEHGEMLLSTRLDSSAPAASTASAGTSNTGRRAVHQHILFGTPTPASADISEVSGTWSGIAIGREEHEGDVPASVDHASDMVVEGEVGIAMSTGGGNARINIDFTDWEGYPDAKFRNVEVTQEGNSYGFDLGSPEGSDWAAGSSGEGSFYGDQFQEIMGTGGFQTATDGRTLNVVYGARKQRDRSDFFPIKAEPEQVTLTLVESFGVSYPAEATLETLVSEEARRYYNYPQFSVFEFQPPENADGIPLQKATKAEADSYAAIAYQAILEHSMFLFQGGIFTPGDARRGGGDPNYPTSRYEQAQFFLSTGIPSTGNPVAGTWEGKAFALEFDASYPIYRKTFREFRHGDLGLDPEDDPLAYIDLDNLTTVVEAEKRIVQGDVKIDVILGGGENITWEFSNWKGGFRPQFGDDYPIVTSEGTTMRKLDREEEPRAGGYSFHHNTGERNENGGITSQQRWQSRNMQLQFYGPGRQEAGGTFAFKLYQSSFHLWGGFAAKKQP